MLPLGCVYSAPRAYRLPLANYHPYKELDEVISETVGEHWRWVPNPGKNHSKGELMCSHRQRGGCIIRVPSTPGRPGNAAKKIRARVAKCPHPQPEAIKKNG